MLFFYDFTTLFSINLTTLSSLILAQRTWQGAGAAALAGTRSEAEGKERQRRSKGFFEGAAASEEKWLRSRQVRRLCRPRRRCAGPPYALFCFLMYFLLRLHKDGQNPYIYWVFTIEIFACFSIEIFEIFEIRPVEPLPA